MVKSIYFFILIFINFFGFANCQAVEDKGLKESHYSLTPVSRGIKKNTRSISVLSKNFSHSIIFNRDLLRHIVTFMDMADAIHLAQTTRFFFQEFYRQSITVSFSNFINKFQHTFKFYLEGASYLEKESKVSVLIQQPNQINYMQLQQDEKKLFSFGVLSKKYSEVSVEDCLKDSKSVAGQRQSFRQETSYQNFQKLLFTLSHLDCYIFGDIVRTYCDISSKNNLFSDWERILCYEFSRRMQLSGKLSLGDLSSLKEFIRIQKNSIRLFEKEILLLLANADLADILTNSSFQKDRQDFAFNLLLYSRPYFRISNRRDSRFKVLCQLTYGRKCDIEYQYQAALHLLQARQRDIDLDYFCTTKKPSALYNREFLSEYQYNSAPIKKAELLRDLRAQLPGLLEKLDEEKRRILQSTIDKNQSSSCMIM